MPITPEVDKANSKNQIVGVVVILAIVGGLLFLVLKVTKKRK